MVASILVLVPGVPAINALTDIAGSMSGVFDPLSVARGGKTDGELRLNLEIAQQEGAFIQTLPPQPAGDFVVALAGIARAAGRHDVLERVASAARERQHAVALQWLASCSAVRTATPRLLESGPLLAAEVVLDASHPALTSSRRAGPEASAGRHFFRVIASLTCYSWRTAVNGSIREAVRAGT
jgi:hypothetical protein